MRKLKSGFSVPHCKVLKLSSSDRFVQNSGLNNFSNSNNTYGNHNFNNNYFNPGFGGNNIVQHIPLHLSNPMLLTSMNNMNSMSNMNMNLSVNPNINLQQIELKSIGVLVGHEENIVYSVRF